MLIKNMGITEKMMYSTLLIETSKGSGTGFIFNFKVFEKEIPVIITNKHVIDNERFTAVKMIFHTIAENGDKVDSEKFEMHWEPEWIHHKKLDLCFTNLIPIIDFAKKELKKNIFFTALDESLILSDNKLLDLNAIESVVMVGYPIGLIDKINNLPIFRKGITATHPGINFENVQIGLVDMACFPGSSGSPIFIYNDTYYVDKVNKKIIMGKSR